MTWVATDFWPQIEQGDGSIFAPGGDGLYKSTDSGSSWTKISTDLVDVSAVFLDVGSGMFLAFGNAGVKYSADFGVTWMAVSISLPAGSLESVLLDSAAANADLTLTARANWSFARTAKLHNTGGTNGLGARVAGATTAVQINSGGANYQVGVYATLDGGNGDATVYINAVAKNTYAIIGVDTITQTFTVAGDHVAEFVVADSFNVSGSTGNNGGYQIVSATLNAGNTDVVTVEVIPDATVDGTITNGRYGTVTAIMAGAPGCW